VVQEISDKPQTLKYADVILPAAAWAEKEGPMTNSERRISHVRKFVDPPGEALPDADILCRFAQKMGYPGCVYSSAEDIYKEHVRSTVGTNISIDGLDYSVMDRMRTVRWPVQEAPKERNRPSL